MQRLVFPVIFAALAFAAQAQDAPAPPPEAPVVAPEANVVNFGASHPQCKAWGDSCVLCTRIGEAIVCSTPGIACTPRDIACTDPKAPE